MHASALAGLSKTTLILVPSNVSALHPAPISPADSESYRNPFDDVGDGETFPGEKIIGFPSPENLSLIRLHGSENTIEFWRQAAVIRDLETQLKNELRAGGHRLVEDREDHSKDGGSRRHASVRSVEWRFAEEAAVEDGEIRVTIEVTEICLRVENVMGLYETRGGQALVVRVEVGG